MVIQLARDGRRVLWLAHESAPKNLTALDVGDPRKPSVIFQSDLAHGDMRSNSLDLAGDLLVVAYQTKAVGMQPAGVEIFDVADPTRPKRVGFFDASGPHSRGTHHLWFVDGTTLHIASGAADFKPRNPKDDQCYRIVDVRNPPRPVEAGRWRLPGTPVQDAGRDWPKLVWMVDGRYETNPVPIATWPIPPVEDFKGRGGRYGAHNLHENRPAPGAWHSETIVVGTFFNGGVRACDVSDPFKPREVAWFVPDAPR